MILDKIFLACGDMSPFALQWVAQLACSLSVIMIVIPGRHLTTCIVMEPARVSRVLVAMFSLATCQYSSFLSPLNDAGIGASQVIFLPSLSSHQSINREQRNIRFPEDELSDNTEIEAVVEYDRISSWEDLDDVIDYSDSVTGNEDHNGDGMSGSYAYMRNTSIIETALKI